MSSALDAVASMGLAPLSMSLQSSMLGSRHLGLGLQQHQHQQQSPPGGRSSSMSPPSPTAPRHRSTSSSSGIIDSKPPSSALGQRISYQPHPSFGLGPPSTPGRQPNVVGGSGSSAMTPASPPPASSNPENNTCRLVDYRGARVAAFTVDGRQLICLPQAFDLFLKHLVGGLHTVYTKLKRLDVIPVVCNVEQVRVLRGLGAIQPGVNRCKLISPSEFDILYDDCTNSSARPGRPPKRSILNATPDGLHDAMKKSRGMIDQIMASPDYFTPSGKHHLLEGSVGSMHHHHHQRHSSMGLGGTMGGPGGANSHRNSLQLAFHGGGVSPSNGCSSAAGLMSLAAELHRSTSSSAAAAINSSASGILGQLPTMNPASVGSSVMPTISGPAPGSTPSAFPYPPAHLAAAAAAAAAAGHFAFLPLAAAAAHPGMMNLATMAAAAGHLHNMRAAAGGGGVEHMMSVHGSNSGGGMSGLHLDPAAMPSRSRGDGSGRVASSTPQTSRSDEFNNNASGGGQQGTGGKTYFSSGLDNDDNVGRRAPSVDRPLNLEMHGRRSVGSTVAAERPVSGSSGNVDDRNSVSSVEPAPTGTAPGSQLDLSKKSSSSSTRGGVTAGNVASSIQHSAYERSERNYGTSSADDVDDDYDDERNSAATDVGVDRSDDEDGDTGSTGCYGDRVAMCNGIQPLMLNGGGVADVEVIGRTTSTQNGPCSEDLVSLEALFVNIQGLMNMAVEKARQREQQIIFEKADLKVKIAKERQIRDTLSKQLVAEQKATDALQRRLRRERKTRRRLELQMRQQHPTSTAPSNDATPRRYGYRQPHSPGGSTDNDENDSTADRHRHPIRRQQVSHDRVLHQPQQQQQQQQQQPHQMTDRSVDSVKRSSSGRRPSSIGSDRSSGGSDVSDICDDVGRTSHGLVDTYRQVTAGNVDSLTTPGVQQGFGGVGSGGQTLQSEAA